MFKSSNKRMNLTLSLLGLGLLGMPIFGQTLQNQEAPKPVEVSDQELHLFADAYEEVHQVQQDLNETINQTITDSSLGEQKFQEIYQAHLAENQEQIDQFAGDTQEQFMELMTEINKLQSDQQALMAQAIDGVGLTVERFNNIIAAIQQDPNLYSKFMEIAQN